MMLEAPKIDSRSGKEIFLDVARALKQRLGVDANGGNSMAEALLRVFGRYCELIIQRLNRVPEKNHLAFLDTLNVSRIPPVPAHVPLTFNPVKKLPGTQVPIVVPARTQVAAPPGEGVLPTTATRNPRLRRISAARSPLTPMRSGIT